VMMDMPTPRWSGAMTVKSCARIGPMVCHISECCGRPCSRTSGGPFPALR